jgi:N-acetylglucosaminyldiphosphoundecaprenol N-acetyl-beta-D-mannosaminyltransferase
MEKSNLKTFKVLGVKINAISIFQGVCTIKRWIERVDQNYVCVTGVPGILECQHDNDLRAVHNSSGLTVPDGMPLVWIGYLNGFKNISRVYGPDLMLEICKISLRKGYTHFLFGGNIGVAEKLRKKLEERFPGIHIVGIYTPPFRPLNEQEEKDLQEQVRKLKPDIFWVGVSTPKQERFMAEYIHKLDTKVMIGVGAAFDIHAGIIKDAPKLFKIIGMQWFYRLCKEPKRLWRRYLYNNPVFVYKYLMQLFASINARNYRP